MSLAESAVKAHLVANVPEVSGRVAGGAVLPPGAKTPALTYRRAGTSRDETQEGTDLLARPRLEIKAWGETYTQAKAVGDAVRRAMRRYSSRGAMLVSDNDGYDWRTEKHFVMLDFRIWHEEAP